MLKRRRSSRTGQALLSRTCCWITSLRSSVQLHAARCQRPASHSLAPCCDSLLTGCAAVNAEELETANRQKKQRIEAQRAMRGSHGTAPIVNNDGATAAPSTAASAVAEHPAAAGRPMTEEEEMAAAISVVGRRRCGSVFRHGGAVCATCSRRFASNCCGRVAT